MKRALGIDITGAGGGKSKSGWRREVNPHNLTDLTLLDPTASHGDKTSCSWAEKPGLFCLASISHWLGPCSEEDDPGQGSSLRVVKLEVPQFLQSLNSLLHFVQNFK